MLADTPADTTARRRRRIVGARHTLAYSHYFTETREHVMCAGIALGLA
jgi:hypothetical protein